MIRVIDDGERPGVFGLFGEDYDHGAKFELYRSIPSVEEYVAEKLGLSADSVQGFIKVVMTFIEAKGGTVVKDLLNKVLAPK